MGLPPLPRLLGAPLVATLWAACATACGGMAPEVAATAPPPPSSGIQFHVGPWQVAPATEIERCVTVPITDDLLLNGFETWTTEHVHHFAMYATVLPLELGEADCAEVLTESVMRLSQTVFSTTYVHHAEPFPEGVAGKFPVGVSRLIFSFHYINLDSKPALAEGYFNLSTTTAERVRLMINGLVAHQREFTLPPHSDQELVARCVTDRPIDVYGLSSHAHARLVNLDIRLIVGGVRPEEPDYRNYEWDTPEIDLYPEAPIHLEPGDSVEWICHYRNDGETPVIEGPHTSDEMCTAVVIYGPDQGFLTCDTTPAEPVQTLTQRTPAATL